MTPKAAVVFSDNFKNEVFIRLLLCYRSQTCRPRPFHCRLVQVCHWYRCYYLLCSRVCSKFLGAWAELICQAYKQKGDNFRIIPSNCNLQSCNLKTIRRFIKNITYSEAIGVYIISCRWRDGGFGQYTRRDDLVGYNYSLIFVFLAVKIL